MMYRYCQRLCCIVGAALYLLGGSYAQSTRTVDPELAAAFQAALEAQEQAQVQFGVSAAVSMPGNAMWLGASGFSNPSTNDPITTDMRFGFASITKTYVAATVLQLVEEGVLTLDDRLNQWLPVYPRINGGISIRHLLGHTSGIYNYTNNSNLWATVIGDPARHWAPEDLIRTFVRSPIFFVGQGGSYSNTNYILLGMIIEQATGTRVSEQFRQRLLDPRNLNATYLSAEEEPTGTLATTWNDYDGDGVIEDFSGFYQQAFHSIRWTTGGMYSIPEEIATWAKALYAGDVLSPAYRDSMLTFHTLTGMNSIWTGYGFGAQQYQVNGVELWGHSGLISGSASLMVYSPEYDVSIAVVDNDGRSNHIAFVADLLQVAIDAATSAPTDVEDENALPESLVLEGAYPNPFAVQTTLAYHLAEPAVIHLAIRNLLGQEVKTLVNTAQASGPHRVVWEGTDAAGQPVAPGIYLYTITAGEQVQSGKVIITR